MLKYKSRNNPLIIHLVPDVPPALKVQKVDYHRALCGAWVTEHQRVGDETECTCKKCKREEM